MSGAVTIRRIPQAERGLIDTMAARYYRELLPQGPLYTPGMLDRYWHEAGRHPYLIEQSGAPIGFALVWNHPDGTHELAEFTINPAFRRRGLGRLAATLIFEALGGDWTMGVARHQPGARAFWESCLRAAPGISGLSEGPARTEHQVCSLDFRMVR